VIIATKFGFVRTADGGFRGVSGRPTHVKAACDASLERLDVDVVDLYYQHRVGPSVPIGETVGAMADLVRAGKVHYLCLSEASPRRSGAPFSRWPEVTDARRHVMPHFEGANFQHHLAWSGTSSASPAPKSTPAQLALAWISAQGDDVVSIAGTRRVGYLEQNVAAGMANVSL